MLWFRDLLLWVSVLQSLQSLHVLPQSLSSFLYLIESSVAYWTLARIPEGDDALLYQRWLGGVFFFCFFSFRWFGSGIGAPQWYKTLISIDFVCLCVRWALRLLSLALLLLISGQANKTMFTSLCPCGRHFTRAESVEKIYIREKMREGDWTRKGRFKEVPSLFGDLRSPFGDKNATCWI